MLWNSNSQTNPCLHSSPKAVDFRWFIHLPRTISLGAQVQKSRLTQISRPLPTQTNVIEKSWKSRKKKRPGSLDILDLLCWRFMRKPYWRVYVHVAWWLVVPYSSSKLKPPLELLCRGTNWLSSSLSLSPRIAALAVMLPQNHNP
jgi:hypothetical protein